MDFDSIYQNESDLVYRYILSKTKDPHLAEEIVQETFYQAVRSADAYDNSCKISTWLCGIARNCLHTWQRKHQIHEELEEEKIPISQTDDAWLAKYSNIEILKALHQLEEPGREVFYMRVFGNLSFREIAEVFGWKESSARSNFYRAKMKLRKELKTDE